MYLSMLGDWKNILRQKRQRKLSGKSRKKIRIDSWEFKNIKDIKKSKRRENERAKTLEI